MDILLSAKSGDVTVWRAGEEFAAMYRQALRDQAASDRSGGTEAVYSGTCAELENGIALHQELLKHLNSQIESVSSATSSVRLKNITKEFYSTLYRHFGQFRSAPAFYQLSMAFLREISSAIIAQATDQLGLPARHLPEIALIAVGPAGRCEYSPFCRLQILIVHGEVAGSHLDTLSLFCHALHAGFEAAGVAIDPMVTPRSPEWRGTLTEWQQRCEQWLRPQEDEELIHLSRLADQYPLHPADLFAVGLKKISCAALNGNRPALTHLMARMASLSNGIGLMGRLKLERSGSERGMFRLLEHGLLPYSAALSALALITGSEAVSSCDRVYDLLKRRELDVELAERMLTTWYSLHDLRLQREQTFHRDEHAAQALCLDPDELTVEQRQLLKRTLESVAIIQRHVEIIFSGME